MKVKTDFFYVVTQPGFEDELIEELSEFWGLLILSDGSRNTSSLTVLSKELGGLLIQCELILGLQINFFSKLASRVLLRISEKKFEKMSQLSQWIISNQLKEKLNSEVFQFKIQTHKSFHWNEKRYLSHLKEKGLLSNSQNDPIVYIRVDNNVMTLSVDTSGEHLHKRGYRFYDNDASIRETAASFCLRKLVQNYGLGGLSEFTIMDSMCGSGTFLFEACELFRPNFRRQFSFLKFSITPKILKSPTLEKNFNFPVKVFKDYVGFDLDTQSILTANKNLNFYAGESDAQLLAKNSFKLKQLDFFSLSPETFPLGNAMLILNPPYGVRKERNFSSEQLIEKIYELKTVANAVLWLKSESKEIEKALKMKNYQYSVHSFKNGGIEVNLYVFSN